MPRGHSKRNPERIQERQDAMKKIDDLIAELEASKDSEYAGTTEQFRKDMQLIGTVFEMVDDKDKTEMMEQIQAHAIRSAGEFAAEVAKQTAVVTNDVATELGIFINLGVMLIREGISRGIGLHVDPTPEVLHAYQAEVVEHVTTSIALPKGVDIMEMREAICRVMFKDDDDAEQS